MERTCPYCPTLLTGRRVQCGAQACKRRYNADRAIKRHHAYFAEHGVSYQRRYYVAAIKRQCTGCRKPLTGTRRADPHCRACRAACHAPRGSALRTRIPPDHPARWFGATSHLTYIRCASCDRTMIQPATYPGAYLRAYCSAACRGRAKRTRRRGREATTYGEWRWSDFMRIAARFNYCCAYCGTKPDSLDPDHVIPVSRGGSNTTSNLLPACRPCNSHKRDLLLGEWQAERERKQLPPVMTHWPPEDRRFAHLTDPRHRAA